ncbi:MAG TPA: DUF6496 domain-containing protein [Rickettsiales bacterium]|nr:DUF6496 domain-containing protein [Rickettsiales bacterium]
MPKESAQQKKTVKRVMHEYKHGELESHGKKVKSKRQAIAIGLHEAGASKYEDKETNKKNLKHTKKKEHEGRTAKQQKEGKS